MQKTIANPGPRARLTNLDIIRGLIMIFMALDHVRLYFTNSPVPPENFAEGGLFLFLARWITHFCAPGFFFIAGAGVFLFEASKGEKSPVVKFLLSRGVWLVFLELTVIGFAWSFHPGWSWAGVIWSLGFCFILLAGLIYLPRVVLLTLSLGVLLFHDGIAASLGLAPFVTENPWLVVFYTGGVVDLPILGPKFILYSIIPWLAVMTLGYVAGSLFQKPAKEQKKLLMSIGGGMIAAFLVLRITNLYGTQDPLWLFRLSGEFAPGATFSDTLASLLNTNKYHASLQFVLMTLGPLLMGAGWLATKDISGPGFGAMAGRVCQLFGRVPFFYYIVHLYLIHGLAFLYTALGGFSIDYMFWSGLFNNSARPEGYGFGIGGVVLIWLFVVAALYLPCRWFQGIKKTHTQWWLKYL